MRILAIDPATKCGWSMGEGLYGTWDLQTRKDESWGMKLIRFNKKLEETYSSMYFDMIVYERPAGRNAQAIITQSKIISQLEVFCEEREIEYRAYSAGEIKKFATGKGNSNKQAMLDAAKKKYGYEGNDDNEADAMHLYYLAMRDYGE